jgi:hypothetical protein
VTRLAHPYRCTNCGQLRERDSNRWWLLLAASPDPSARRSGAISLSRRLALLNTLTVFPWDDELARQKRIVHSCGEVCATTLVSRWLATGDFLAPSQRPLTSHSPLATSHSDIPAPTGKENE